MLRRFWKIKCDYSCVSVWVCSVLYVLSAHCTLNKIHAMQRANQIEKKRTTSKWFKRIEVEREREKQKDWILRKGIAGWYFFQLSLNFILFNFYFIAEYSFCFLLCKRLMLFLSILNQNLTATTATISDANKQYSHFTSMFNPQQIHLIF